MNLPKRLQLINSGQLLAYTCLLVFSLLMSLWADRLIGWSIWAVFLPLWFWKLVVLLGALTGIISWSRHPEARLDHSASVDFRAMVISTALHLLVVLFELLVCLKIENPSSVFPWSLVFCPIFFLSLMSTVLCVWAVRNDRNFQVELMSAVNILQFTFISIKLDGYINWNWLLVFIPLWVLLSTALVLTVYNVIVTALLTNNVQVQQEQKRFRLQVFITHLVLVISFATYLVLLVQKLEGMLKQYYSVLGIPLYISLVCLVSLAFSSRPANSWWFGLKKDLCQFLLTDACPCLQEYGNIKYKFTSQVPPPTDGATPERPAAEPSRHGNGRAGPGDAARKSASSSSVSALLIDMPD